jgi:hypothetical protein
MYAAGLPVPANLDGRALKEICADEFVAANPLKTASPAESPTADRETLTENEERLIEEKLRSLGYL